MPLANFRLHLAPGTEAIIVNGENVTGRVAEVGIKAPIGGVPELWLKMLGEATIEGEGIVRVLAEGADIDEAAAVVQFLESIDPEQLEADALSGMGLGDESGTAAILDQLKRYARGDS